MSKNKRGTGNQTKNDLSQKQTEVGVKKEEELVVEENKKVLVIETGLVDYERRRSIEDLFGKRCGNCSD